MPVSPRTPPGVLELLPPQQLAFQRMLDTIRHGFERFGFLPIETPVFELTDVLLTKSGGETEKQVYFVQSTGALKQYDPNSEKLPEFALRFDLTVPLARYVAEHEQALNFPFRRYQIQRVYRGERAQKGRYREFYQCDIDVIARDTLPLAYDAELPAVIHGIFAELGLGAFTIYLNNRKLLRGLLEGFGIAADQHAAVLHEVDRLGKQDRADIEKRLAALGIANAARLLDLLTAHAGDSRAILAALAAVENPTPLFVEGLDELRRVYEGTLALGVPPKAIQLNLAIARGLDYYTGTVYETFLDDHRGLGSICSGGRYAELASHYTKASLPGVGISIGVTRLFSHLVERAEEAAKQLAKPDLTEADRAVAAQVIARLNTASISDVLVTNLEPELARDCAAMAAELRAAGLNVEIYSDDRAADKKLKHVGKYLDRARVPFAILYGTRDRDAGIVKLKDLRDGAATKVHEVPRGELAARVKALR